MKQLEVIIGQLTNIKGSSVLGTSVVNLLQDRFGPVGTQNTLSLWKGEIPPSHVAMISVEGVPVSIMDDNRVLIFGEGYHPDCISALASFHEFVSGCLQTPITFTLILPSAKTTKIVRSQLGNVLVEQWIWLLLQGVVSAALGVVAGILLF